MSLVIIPVVVLTGCATGSTSPTYKSTVHSATEGAQVRGSRTWGVFHSTAVIIERVDGCWLSPWNRTPTSLVLVDPGMRSLDVYGEYLHPFLKDVGQVELKAMLRAGHAYQIQFEQKERLMTFWVEDVATHEAVSERQSTNATVHLEPGSFPVHF